MGIMVYSLLFFITISLIIIMGNAGLISSTLVSKILKPFGCLA